MVKLTDLVTDDIIQSDSGYPWMVTVCHKADATIPTHVIGRSLDGYRSVDNAQSVQAIFDELALRDMKIIVPSPLRKTNGSDY